MPTPKTEPPWEFLLSASRNSLQSYELSRLSHAANLRKEIGQLLDTWLEETAAAMLARWLIEQQRVRPRLLRMRGRPANRGPSIRLAGDILCPIMFSRIKRSRGVLLAARRDGQLLFGGSNRFSRLLMPLRFLLAQCSTGVPGSTLRPSCKVLSHTRLLSASHPRVSSSPSLSVKSGSCIALSAELRLGCFICIRRR